MKRFILILLVLIVAVGIGITIFLLVGNTGRHTLQHNQPYFITQMRHNTFFDSSDNHLHFGVDGAHNSSLEFNQNFSIATFNFVSYSLNHSIDFIITSSSTSRGGRFSARMTGIVGGELIRMRLRSCANYVTIRADITETVVNEGEVRNVIMNNVIVLIFARAYS